MDLELKGTTALVIGAASGIGRAATRLFAAEGASIRSRHDGSQARIVCVCCPGMVQTPLNRSVWAAWCETVPESDRLSYEQWAGSKIQSVVPLQRWQSCEDVASMIVFLASARASQVTGQTINVDGGQVMHW